MSDFPGFDCAWIRILGKAKDYQEPLEQKRKLSYDALKVLENQLEIYRFFVGDRYTIIPINLFAYTYLATEAGVKVTVFPVIQAGIKPLIDRANYIPMDF